MATRMATSPGDAAGGEPGEELAAPAPRPVALETARGVVECATIGEGPAVLALHGAMGGFDQGLVLARAVGAPGFRYIAPSRPGYLGTPLAVGKTPQEQADVLAALLDALSIRDAAVVAVSGGGPSALAFALRHPERCRGLVVVSSCCSRIEGGVPLAWRVMKVVARVPWLVAAMRRRLERDPDGAARRSIPDPEQRRRTLGDPEASALLRALQRSTFDRMPLRLLGTDNDVATTTGELTLPVERIAVPVLVVHGTADRLAPFAKGREIATRVPGAELLAIEGGEHVALFTHLRAIRARVSAFLLAHAAPPGGV